MAEYIDLDAIRFNARRVHAYKSRRNHPALQNWPLPSSSTSSEEGFLTRLKTRLSESATIAFITSQLGLGLPWAAQEEDVRNQATIFCKEFIHTRLKRLGFLGASSKNGIRPASSSAGTRDPGVSSVCREMQAIGSELERLFPTLYKDITKQLNVNVSSEQIADQVLVDIGDAIFKSGITWAKIVAFFVVSSSLSVECLQQGNGVFVHSITQSLTRYVQSKLVQWIAQRGGWVSIHPFSSHLSWMDPERPIIEARPFAKK